MSQPFVIKVFFRGDWCPWCSAYLKDFEQSLSTVTALGGSVRAITSQAGNQSKANLGLSYDVEIDEANAQAAQYGIFVTPKAQSPLADVEGVYPNGMVQPGVVVERAGGEVLYKWAINPSEMNFGGATDRPLVSDIVGSLESLLRGDTVDGGSFGRTDMAYLEAGHAVEHGQVQAYLASQQQ